MDFFSTFVSENSGAFPTEIIYYSPQKIAQKNRAVLLGVFGISTYPSEEPTDLYRSISDMYNYVNIYQHTSI